MKVIEYSVEIAVNFPQPFCTIYLCQPLYDTHVSILLKVLLL